LAPAARVYIVAQFVVSAVGILWIGSVFAEQGAAAVLLPCLLLWVTLYSLGMISENRPRARGFEVLRLLVVTPLAILGLDRLGLLEQSVILWAVAALYAVVSLAILPASRPQAAPSGS
jgi:hypothetical protein